jgi:hypothetical protein
MPSLPHVQQLLWITRRRDDVGCLIDIQALLLAGDIAAVFAFAVLRFEPASQL